FGVISSVDGRDRKGPYLVRFEDGTQFRYVADEIESTQTPHSRNHLLGRIMKSHFQMFFAVVLVSSMLALAACSGPAPAPQPQPKAAETQEVRPAVEPAPPTPVEQPRVQAAAKPKPAAKPKTASTATVPATPAKQAPQTASNTSSSTSGGLTLPAPVPPPIDVPGPPPVEVKAPEPQPRQVTVPSGTLVAVRMIDSVNSETAHVGETFKGSLDAPIVIDNDTVFPRGSEVFVKVSKVESAGRVSGRSELQLQLDRIFLGKKSYTLESSTYANTGASQGARTARTGALGAAIGAAIGAISGGGKGAVIGCATGAAAGVGAEAIRKGEQIKVYSESRLDFRLEEPLQVTLQSPSPNTIQPRNNPSDPPRFGTRQK